MSRERSDNRVTKDSIRRAAATVFRDRGFRGATLNEIADIVGVHKATLYHYIDSKEQLLLETLEDGLEPSFNKLKELALDGNTSPRDRLYKALHATTLQACLEKESVAVYTQRLEDDISDSERRDTYVRNRREYEDLVRQFVRDCLEELHLEDDPKLGTLAVLGMANWAAQWFDPAGQRSADEIAHVFARLGVRAVGYSDDK